ncbi:MAG: hypothetical protein GXO39_05610 [Thermotogae bacterium]|nr:hypothetical protein [Thermotogota bacterium]
MWNYPLRALTVKKLLLAFLFLMVGLFLYSLLTYLSYYMAELDLSRVWNLHHLFPVPIWAKSFPEYIAERGGKVLFPTDWSRFPPVSKVIWSLGVIFLLWTYFSAGIGVAKLEVEAQRGDPFYPLSSALKEALKRSGLFWTTMGVPVGVGVVVVIVHAIPAVWGRLNILFYPATLLITVLFGFLVILSLLFIYVLAGYVMVLLYGPVVSVAMEGDTFDLFYEGFSILNEKLHRLVFYETWFNLLRFVAFSLFTFFLFRAVRLSAILLEFLLPRFKFVYYPALSHFTLPQLPYILSYYLAFILPMDIYAPLKRPVPLPTTYTLSLLFDVWMLVFLVVSLSYWVSLTWTGRLYSYAHLLKEKDGIDIFAVRPVASLEELRNEGKEVR